MYRYHSDPDQGALWGFDTAVVSVGETRRFCFRPTPLAPAPRRDDGTQKTGLKASSLSSARDDAASGPVHLYTVFDGDVVHMFGDCQQTYQHTVRQAERAAEGTHASGPRASLVFKCTLR